MRTILIGLIALVLATGGQAQSLAQVSNGDAASGLKEALAQGAAQAVSGLGQANGFMGNPKVKISLPPSLEKASGMMRKLGMGKQVDALESSMNRAAEAAVPEAKALLTQSIKAMSLQDAKGILSGGENAATEYFRRTTSEQMGEKFKPIVQKAMAQTQVSETYNSFASKASKFGLLKPEDSQLDGYVTRKALDGLYLMIAEEEKAIRKNPLAAAGNLAKMVFGALGK